MLNSLIVDGKGGSGKWTYIEGGGGVLRCVHVCALNGAHVCNTRELCERITWKVHMVIYGPYMAKYGPYMAIYGPYMAIDIWPYMDNLPSIRK